MTIGLSLTVFVAKELEKRQLHLFANSVSLISSFLDDRKSDVGPWSTLGVIGKHELTEGASGGFLIVSRLQLGA